jgi:GTPase SAR1 family protein
MTFADRVAAAQEAARADADQAITGLAEVAGALEMFQRQAELAEIGSALRSDLFKVTIFGRMKAGKSTFLNALLADTTHPVELGGEPGPLPTDDQPCSAVLTELVYSAEPYVKVWGRDETWQAWTLSRYREEAKLDPELSEEENKRRFDWIRRFEVGYPARLLQSVILVDTPGTDEEEGREVMAHLAGVESDAVLVAFGSHALMGSKELADAEEVVQGKLGVFTVVNVWQPKALDDRHMRARVWNTYLRPHLDDPDAHPWADQDLEGAYRIYFVNALRALEGRRRGDETAVKTFGLAAFEDRLSDFLVTERAAAHIVSHVHRAQPKAAEMAAWITERQAAYRAGQEEFERWRKEMEVALYQAQARGKVIRELTATHRRDLVELLLQRHRNCELQIVKDLKPYLMKADIPVLRNLLGGLRPKTVQAQLQEATAPFVAERRKKELKESGKRLDEALLRLARELGEKLDQALEPVSKARLAMPGREELPEDFELISRNERVIAGAIAVVTGNAFAAAGANGGIRPVLGGIGGMMVGGLVLGVLGVVSLPVVIPVALIGALLGGLFGVKGARERFVDTFVNELEKILEAGAEEQQQTLTSQMEGYFDAIAVEAERAFQESIEAQRSELERQAQSRLQESHVRAERLRVLEWAAATVVEHRGTLEAAIRTGRQRPDAAA